MKETGIIMTGNHPRLILDLKKSMTRRTYGLEVVNQHPDDWEFLGMESDLAVFRLLRKHRGDIVPARSRSREIRGKEPNLEFLFKCPYGGVGDLLWVRATWAKNYKGQMLFKYQYHSLNEMFDLPELNILWKPSIHLHKEDAEIWLEITDIRAERLQEITEEDALAEGIKIMQGTWQAMGRDSETGRPILLGEPQPYTTRYHFEALWDSLNAKRGYGWDTNCWVFPIGFKLI